MLDHDLRVGTSLGHMQKQIFQTGKIDKEKNLLPKAAQSWRQQNREWGESILIIFFGRTTKKVPEDVTDSDVLRDWTEPAAASYHFPLCTGETKLAASDVASFNTGHRWIHLSTRNSKPICERRKWFPEESDSPHNDWEQRKETTL